MYPCAVTEICRGSAHSFVYIDTDAHEGMSLREWRSVRPATGRRDGDGRHDPSASRPLPR